MTLPSLPRPALRRPPNRPAWLSPRVARTEILAGLVVALALIPEALSFSIIAHVDPQVGIFSAFTMAVTAAFVGGRPAMISAATGAVALLVAPLSAEYGLQYLIAAVLLAGVLQIAFGLLGIARLMNFLPRSVMLGFVNGLGIMIFLAQLRHLWDVPWLVYPLVVLGLVVIVGLPRLTTAVPSPLIGVVVVTGLAIAAGFSVPTLGAEGKMAEGLPSLGIPDIPWTLETLRIIAPYSIGVALVGLLESLLTARLVDDITDTPSNKTRESAGQGICNIVTGAFGGMGGCALIGQTMINVKSGARTRLSTFLAGVFLLVLAVGFGPQVARIPMAALVAVMIFVAFTTLDWHSLRPGTLRRMPKSETITMAVTVAVVLATHNLAFGVIAGVLVASVAFARRVAGLVDVSSVRDPEGGSVIYSVSGELFFASSNDLVTRFDYANDPDDVVIDMTQAHVWDASSVAALDGIEAKYAARGKTVRVIGMNGYSSWMRRRLEGQLTSSH